MSRRFSSSRSRSAAPLVAFILVASFGILFAGCNGPEDVPDDEIVFTQDDVARYRELAEQAQGALTGSGSSGAVVDKPYVEPLASGSGKVKQDSVDVDLSNVDAYKAMRSGMSDDANGTFQVNNDILNVRETASSASKSLAVLKFGDPVQVLDFVSGQWAKVKTSAGVEGYVSNRYISKVTSDEKLADEQKQYENMYYVNYAFVNMRKEPSQGSEKIGEIPGQKIIKIQNADKGWAKVSYDGKEGYVSMPYLAKFSPNFIVRQETYELPVLQYRLTKGNEQEVLQSMGKDVDALKQEGYTFITFAQFYDLLQRQQQRDVRLDPKRVIVAMSGITPTNLKAVSDALNVHKVDATLFLQTQDVGLTGITEKNILTLQANGFDIQSAGHTGDDLRALTNAQVELELKQSRKILEDYTHKPVFAVAYPQGGVNDRVSHIAADAGYLIGVSDDAQRTFTRDQLLHIPSMVVFPTATVEEVLKFVKGQ